jgi:hypothetical protein
MERITKNNPSKGDFSSTQSSCCLHDNKVNISSDILCRRVTNEHMISSTPSTRTSTIVEKNNSICIGRAGKSCHRVAIQYKTYCVYHDYEVCQGLTKKGEPCEARRRTNSLFCRDMHDPTIIQDYTDPTILRLDGIRNKKMETVLLYRQSKDPYRGVQIAGCYSIYYMA